MFKVRAREAVSEKYRRDRDWVIQELNYLSLQYRIYCSSRDNLWDFPGGTAVKNPPANARDTGSSPGPGRSHVLRSN